MSLKHAKKTKKASRSHLLAGDFILYLFQVTGWRPKRYGSVNCLGLKEDKYTPILSHT